jgi:hypothetical protein
VVGAAVEGFEVEEGVVGRGDVGLLEPEGEIGEGESIGLGVGGDGGGGDEGFEERRLRRRNGKWQMSKWQSRSWEGGGVGDRGEEGALTPAISRRGLLRGRLDRGLSLV